MLSQSRKCSLLCLCFLLLGIIIGIAIDAEFRPNHIKFWVNLAGDLSLVFQPGDKIEWTQLENGKDMKINFQGPNSDPNRSPCSRGTSNPCIIGNIPAMATYYYTCTGADDVTFVCNDPQGGPGSVTNLEIKKNQYTFRDKIFDLGRNVLTDLSQIFGQSVQTGSPGAPPKTAAKASPTYPNIYATVSCVSGATAAQVITNFDSKPNDPIQAMVGQKIIWQTSASDTLVITPGTLGPSLICKPSISSVGNQTLCTASQSGTYIATIGCGSTPSNPSDSVNVSNVSAP